MIRQIRIISAILIVLLLCSCSLPINKDIVYDFEASMLVNDFEMIDDKVYIECNICLTNRTDNKQTFSMQGDFNEDYKLKLTASRYLTAFAADDLSKSDFVIEANKTTKFSVVFVGDFAGNAQKFDREPPNAVVITVIEK